MSAFLLIYRSLVMLSIFDFTPATHIKALMYHTLSHMHYISSYWCIPSSLTTTSAQWHLKVQGALHVCLSSYLILLCHWEHVRS